MSHAGRDFFVTLTPPRSRTFRPQVVKQFTRTPRRPPTSYADALNSEFPSLPTKPGGARSSDPSDRILNLERLVQSLVGLLAHSGVQLPSDVQSMLHSSGAHPKDASTMDVEESDADSDPYQGDWHEGMPAPKDDINDAHVEEAPKRPRIQFEKVSPAARLRWAHAASPLSALGLGSCQGGWELSLALCCPNMGTFPGSD